MLTSLLFDRLWGFRGSMTSSSARSIPAMKRAMSQRLWPKQWITRKLSTARRTAAEVRARATTQQEHNHGAAKFGSNRPELRIVKAKKVGVPILGVILRVKEFEEGGQSVLEGFSVDLVWRTSLMIPRSAQTYAIRLDANAGRKSRVARRKVMDDKAGQQLRVLMAVHALDEAVRNYEARDDEEHRHDGGPRVDERTNGSNHNEVLSL
ncbi:hypothetical protein DL768_010580 [Monosporascus sp. mg162]|nr:hypothetical protein DL768_010580 [Monosporascus sp. mg162]